MVYEFQKLQSSCSVLHAAFRKCFAYTLHITRFRKTVLQQYDIKFSAL